MRIIGCDLHAAQQTIAMLDRETGEIVERTLKHDGMTVREVQRAGWSHLRTADAVDSACRALAELGWLRLERTSPGSKGGAPSVVLRLHPELPQGGLR